MTITKFALLSAAACLLPMGALAQNAVCGVSTAIVAGGEMSNADLSSIADPLQFSVELSGAGPAVYQFDVTSNTDIRVEASDSDGADPVIVLLNASGVELASDDDGGGGRSSRIETSVAPGTYCVQVNAYGSQAGITMVQFGRFDHIALTPGADFGGGMETTACTAETPAEPLTAGSLNAALSGGSNVSLTRTGSPTYHRFTLDQPLALTISGTNTEADPVLALYDANGALVVENDDFDGLNAQINQQSPLAAGDYCLAVSALSDSNAPITVAVSEFDPVAYLNGRYDRVEAAPPINGDYPVQDIGTLSTSLSSDIFVGANAVWITYNLAEASMVVMEAIGNGQVDPVITLFSERGTQLAQNDDGPTSYDSQIAMELQAGRYLIAITQYDDTDSGVVRAYLQRYVRAQ